MRTRRTDGRHVTRVDLFHTDWHRELGRLVRELLSEYVCPE